jgi:hydrogenase maturation protein HypF
MLRLDGLWQRLADADPLAPFEARCTDAARFHASLGAALGAWAGRHAAAQGLRRLALGGGCLLNRELRRHLLPALERAGLDVLEAVQAPPGDGGLSLGQVAVALQSLGAVAATGAPSPADPPTDF